MFNLMPRDTKFFDLFEGLAKHGISCANHLHQMMVDFPNVQAAATRIRQEEHDADQLTHQALDRLDRTFITPFDREDIHMLVGELDTIVDNINSLSKRFTAYQVKNIEPAFVKQSEILVSATVALADCVMTLRHSRKLNDFSERLIEVHRLENLGDDNHLAAMSKLFSGTQDTLEVIKWREFYLLLESALDGCEDASNIIERIVLKNG